MKEIYKYIKNNILISTAICALTFTLIHLILNLFRLKFIYMVYIIAIVIFIICIVIGIFQLIFKLKKVVKIISLLLFTIILIICLPLIYLIICSRFQPTYILEKNGQKMLAQVVYGVTVEVEYYDYKFPFIINKTPRMIENYGDGAFNPIGNSRYSYDIEYVLYYDKKGNRVKDFDGTPYIDLSDLEVYSSSNANYDEVIEFLEKIKEKYKNNFSKIKLYYEEDTKSIMEIYFSESENEIINENGKIRIENTINEFIENIKLFEKLRGHSSYKIFVFDTGDIFISDNEYRKVNTKIAGDVTEEFVSDSKKLSGRIYYKDLDYIFFETSDNEYLKLKNDERIKFVNGKTNEEYQFGDIKIDSYIDTLDNNTVLIYENNSDIGV